MLTTLLKVGCQPQDDSASYKENDLHVSFHEAYGTAVLEPSIHLILLCNTLYSKLLAITKGI